MRDAELESPDLLPEPAVDEFGPWSLGDYLQAQLIDAVRENTYVTAVAGGVEPTPKPPKPTPRPGLRREPSVDTDLAQAQILYLNQFRARG